MALNSPKDGAPGTTDQSPRWEGPQGTKPAGYRHAKDDPEKARDAHGENLNHPNVKKVSDAMKTKEDD